jgi:hypothetical protein
MPISHHIAIELSRQNEQEAARVARRRLPFFATEPPGSYVPVDTNPESSTSAAPEQAAPAPEPPVDDQLAVPSATSQRLSGARRSRSQRRWVTTLGR